MQSQELLHPSPLLLILKPLPSTNPVTRVRRGIQQLLIFGSAAAKSLQSCPTLCKPIDGSPPSSAVPGILQTRALEWVAIAFSNAWKWKKKVKSLSRVRLLVTPWTTAYQAPPSMGFSRQEYWSGLPLPSPNLFLLKLNCPSLSTFCWEMTCPVLLLFMSHESSSNNWIYSVFRTLAAKESR